MLIMDEVDGMSSGDHGGMAELISVIKTTQIPIVCICNDRQSPKVRTLRNHCLDLTWRRPTAAQMAPRIASICKYEGLGIPNPDMHKICTAANGDVRQALNLLQMWAINFNAETFASVPLEERLLQMEKNTDLNLFDVPPKLFSFARYPLEEHFGFYYADNLMPLMIQENYLSCRPTARMFPTRLNRKIAENKCMAEAAMSISDGDLIEATLMETQSWSLSQAHALTSTIRPAYWMQGSLGAQLNFPGWLSKYGPTKKHKNWLAELSMHMSPHVSCSNPSVVCLDYLPALRTALVAPLTASGVNGIDNVFEVMTSYSLSREDFDAVFELTDLGISTDPYKGITSTVKAAFTRRWNKEHAKLTSVPHKRAAPKVTSSEVGFDLDDAPFDTQDTQVPGADGQDDDEAVAPDDLELDQLIVKKTKPATTSASTTKRK